MLIIAIRRVDILPVGYLKQFLYAFAVVDKATALREKSRQNGNGDGICSIGWKKKGSGPNQLLDPRRS